MGQQNQGGLLDLISQGVLQPWRQLTSKQCRRKRRRDSQEAWKPTYKSRLKRQGGEEGSSKREDAWWRERDAACRSGKLRHKREEGLARHQCEEQQHGLAGVRVLVS